MGATVRPREFDADQPSHTEQLANWINRVRSKKIMCRRSRKRNLRVEAVLTSVLSKAEHELRSKQMSRIVKWQQMKQRLLEDMTQMKQKLIKDMAYKNGAREAREYKDGEFKDGGGGGYGAFHSSADEANSYGDVCTRERYSEWPGSLCPELSSLDSFMSQLNEIKVPLQR